MTLEQLAEEMCEILNTVSDEEFNKIFDEKIKQMNDEINKA